MKYLMVLLVALALTACGNGDWDGENYSHKDECSAGGFLYGPAEWLADNTPLTVNSPCVYDVYYDPEIKHHALVDQDVFYSHCGKMDACADTHSYETGVCDVYYNTRALPSAIAHEERHCHGQTHYGINMNFFDLLEPEAQNVEIAKASTWYVHPKFQGKEPLRSTR
jgi:hypothetical protein